MYFYSLKSLLESIVFIHKDFYRKTSLLTGLEETFDEVGIM